jgi:(p)ppGpp synthase/HD superfamily hydrolase
MVIDNRSLTFGIAERSLVEKAALIAFVGHAGQVRKDGGSPYVVHPYMAALKLAAHGFEDRVLAAALVHDVLEDTQVTPEQLEQLLGRDVVDIVRSLTEDKALPWETRKERYIEAIRVASDEVKAVSTADKIHNLESLFAAYALQGPEIWKVFNRGREQKCWFERALLKTLQETWTHPLVHEYAKLVERLDTLE